MKLPPRIRRSKRSARPGRAHQGGTSARRVRPTLEGLEERTLLSTSIPLNPATWTPLGPSPLYADGGFVSNAQGQRAAANNPAWVYSGRVTGLAADPTNANVAYAATAGGGVWKTIDGGTTWAPLTDNQATLVTGAIAVAPGNPNVIYVGTGEANLGPSKTVIGRNNISYGRGVLRSADGGASWILEPGNAGVNEFDRRTISRIVVDPLDPNTVYLTVGAQATNGLAGNTGVWKSTNGGLSWTDTTAAISTTAAFSDLAMDPSNRLVLYAAVGDPNGNAASGLYKTTDGGAHWTALTNFPTGTDPHVGRITIAESASAPLTLYAAVANVTHTTDTSPQSSLYEMLKSTDGGATWVQLSGTPNFMGVSGDYDATLVVDRSNPNAIYAGGGAGAGTLVRSLDGGATWQDVGLGVDGNGPHGGHHAMAFDAAGRLLEGNDGGVWRLDDANPATLHWTNLNAGLATIQLNGVALDPFNPNFAYAGAQDNGTVGFSDSLTWNLLDNGDGGVTLVSFADTQTLYHDGPVADFGPGNYIQFSDDGGTSWEPATTGINAAGEPTAYIPPLVMDPANANRLLTGTSRVYESLDGGTTWAALSTPGVGGWTASTAIDAIAVAPSNGNTIYAATKGHIFVTFNHGASWAAADVPGFADHIAWLLVDPSNNLVAYAARDRFTGGSGGHVFKTTDGGAHWTDLSAGLPDVPVNTLALDSRTGTFFAGTDTGVFATTNGGASWAVYKAGIPNVRVTQLQLNPGTNILAAATHGRGLWEIALSTATSAGPAPIANGQVPGNGPVSGRVTGVTTDPNNVNVIWVSTAGGGVWRTSDGGQSWIPLSDGQATLVTGAIVYGAVHGTGLSSPVLYAGTGEANNSADSYYGRGVLRSIDGGQTWELLTGNAGVNEFDRRVISRVAANPVNPSIVLVAVAGAGVNGLAGGTGIFRSIDGGQTWLNTTATISTTAAFTDVVFDPSNLSTVYAAIGTPTGDVANGVYKSSNGGQTWTRAGNFPGGTANGLIRLGVAKTNPAGQHVVYASVTSPTTGALLQLYKSTDGGVTWTALSGVPNYLGSTGAYASTLAVDPSNAGIVYAAGGAGANSIIESRDGGVTWIDLSVGATGDNGPHGGHHGLAFDAQGRLLDVNDGGVWRLDNPLAGSVHWTDLTANLGVTQLVGVALSPTDVHTLYGGSQGNGTDKTTGSAAWTQIRGGDGGFVRIDPTNPLTVYHTFGYGSGFLERSDDGGVTWVVKTTGINAADPGNYDIPYLIDPANASRLILGTNRVYETTNRGDLWVAISTPNTGGWTTNAKIDALAVRGSTVYASAGGHIFVTTNDGATWTRIDIPGFADHFAGLAIDPTNTLIAYAVRDRFSTATGGHVFKTTNGGATWADISTSLANRPVNAIAIDPRTSVLYAGTDTGVVASRDGGATWLSFGVGLTNARVSELQLNPTLGVLAVATYGRGAWELPLTRFSVTSSATALASGTAFSVTVTALDPFGNVITGYRGTVHFTSTDGGASLPANYTFTATDNGVHTFAGVTLAQPGIDSLFATDIANAAATGAVSVVVSPALATHLALSVSGGIVAGQAFTVTVTALDVNNHVVAGYGGTVSFTTSDSKSGVVVPGPYQFAVSDAGVHTFASGFTLITAGQTSISVADGAGLSGSLVVTVSPAAPDHLLFGQQPTNAVAGQTLSPAVTVLVVDQFNNLAAGAIPVTLSIASGPAGATLLGTLTQATVGGVATFADLSLRTAGSYTLLAASGGLTGATSASFAISPAAPDHLVFGQQPTNTATGAVIAPPVTVLVVDAFGNLESADNTDQVTLALASNPGGATLSGTLTRTVSAGVATFADLSLNKAGTGYTLGASSGALAGATSAPFNVTDTLVVLENFESGTLTGYTTVGATNPTAVVAAVAAHDGSFGLRDRAGADWIYRNDSAARVQAGDTVYVWLKLATLADGKAWFGFGATSGGTLSLVVSAGTKQLILQKNVAYGAANMATVSQTFLANHWYKLEVDWNPSGKIVGKLLDSDGVTLLKSVTATTKVITSGGFAFKATGHDKYWDTVTVARGVNSNVSAPGSDVAAAMRPGDPAAVARPPATPAAARQSVQVGGGKAGVAIGSSPADAFFADDAEVFALRRRAASAWDPDAGVWDPLG